MKKMILAFGLICPWVAVAETHRVPMHFIEIQNCDVLHLIDGTAVVNLIRINEFRKGMRKIHFLEKQIEIDGILYSMKDLTEHEINGTLSPEQLAEAFIKVIALFEALAIPYMKDAEGSEKFIKEIVKQWSIQRNKQQSLLVHWSALTPAEQAVFYKTIKNFQNLTHFLEDLELFLGDFMKSCKKSLAQLQKLTQKK